MNPETKKRDLSALYTQIYQLKDQIKLLTEQKHKLESQARSMEKQINTNNQTKLI